MRHDIPPDIEAWIELRLLDFADQHRLIDHEQYLHERLRLGRLYRRNRPMRELDAELKVTKQMLGMDW